MEGDTCTVTVTVEGEHTNAGDYTATATALSNDNYKLPEDCTCSFAIEKADIELSVSITGWTYGDEPNEPSVTGNDGNGTVAYTYAQKGSEDFASDVPEASGTYIFRASVEDTDNYNGGEDTAEFTIAIKSVEIPTEATDLKWTGEAQTGVAEGDDYTVTNGSKTDVGNYTATATLNDTDNTIWSDDTTEEKSIEWSIDKADSPDAPTGLEGVAPTTVDGDDGKITGVDETMEYASDAEFGDATGCDGTEITGLTADTYYVRLKETATHYAGEAATVEVPDPETCTVTFAAGYDNPTGTMDDEIVVNGASYTLPDCGFDAPSDKVFSAWKIGQTEYAAGAEITVEADITATAQWEDEVITAPTFAAYRLRLSGVLGLKYYMRMPEDFDGTGAQMAFTIEGRTQTVAFDKAETETVADITYWVFECTM